MMEGYTLGEVMKRINAITCLLLLFGMLVACNQPLAESINENPEDEPLVSGGIETPVPEGGETGDSINHDQDGIDYSHLDLSTKIYMYLCDYGSMPVFSDISRINEDWLIETFFQYKYTVFDENAGYSWQFIATIQDIEEMASMLCHLKVI